MLYYLLGERRLVAKVERRWRKKGFKMGIA